MDPVPESRTRGCGRDRVERIRPRAEGRRRATPPPSSPATPQKFFMDDLDLMVEEMKAAKADGVACLVDGGHEDMGRKLENLKIMSERSGLPIVAGGGFYAQPFYPPRSPPGAKIRSSMSW